MQVVKNSGRLFVCTDLHGNIHTLHKMLNKVGFDATQDLLVNCGDLVDRGPDSADTLKFFLYDQTGAYLTVRGNHDQFLADFAHKDEPSGNWVYFNGGVWALNEERHVLKTYAEDVLKLPVHLSVDFHGNRYAFVHAEVPARFKTWGDFTNAVDADTSGVLEIEAMWSRDIIYGQQCDALPDVKYVFHGHTVVDRPTIVNNRVYLDLGYVFKRLLCLIEITPEGNLVAHFRDRYADRVFTKGETFIIAE